MDNDGFRRELNKTVDVPAEFEATFYAGANRPEELVGINKQSLH